MRHFFFFLSITACLSFNVCAQSNDVGAGISLVLDGSAGNYVDLGDVFSTVKFPFSFEAWMKPSAYDENSSAIFSSDCDPLAATGFSVMLTPNGNVLVEFGDGLGMGRDHTNGFISATAIPLNRWSHVAVVCKSMTDVKIYISGLLQVNTPTGGSWTGTSFTHTAAPAAIGHHVGNGMERGFNGELDEIRFWTRSISQFTLREGLCKKQDPAATGLTGYWVFDESYESMNVNDLAGLQENGNITGSVNRVNSTAPIGNEVRYKYATDWFDVKVTLKAPLGDKLMTQNITGDGIYVYRVDALPLNTDGLEVSPIYYYGVFCIDVNTPASYNLRYKYANTDGIVTEDNENMIELMGRSHAAESWTDLNGIIDYNTNWITKHDGASIRGEYTINVPSGEKHAPVMEKSNPLTVLNIYPNPSADVVHIHLSGVHASIQYIRILNAEGSVIRITNVLNNETDADVDVSGLENGIYFADVVSASGHTVKQFVVQR